MSKNTEANHENQHQTPHDALTEILHNGAHRLIAQAVEAELEQMLAEHQEIKTLAGHRAGVRRWR